MKVTNPNTKICAMCIYWNGAVGGKSVKPRVGMRNIYEYEPDEKNVCYDNHFIKSAWHSCNRWNKKF